MRAVIYPLFFVLVSSLLTAVSAQSVVISGTMLTTSEAGAPVDYLVSLSTPPDAGETVTITPSSNDVTEGTVSGAVMFTDANWDVPVAITVFPGASGDGNDGDVAYTINNLVSSSLMGGAYDGITASDVSATNQNIDGVQTIIVNPSSGIILDEELSESTIINFTVTDASSASDDITINLVNNNPADVMLSTTSIVLTSANSYSADLTVTAINEILDEGIEAFSIETQTSIDGSGFYGGIDPVDITGFITDDDAVDIIVSPSTGIVLDEEIGESTIVNFTVSDINQTSGDIVINLVNNNPDDIMLSTMSIVLTATNSYSVDLTVTAINDALDEGMEAFSITTQSSIDLSGFYDGIDPVDIDGVINDDDAFNPAIPTMGQWSLIILCLLLLIAGVVSTMKIRLVQKS